MKALVVPRQMMTAATATTSTAEEPVAWPMMMPSETRSSAGLP